MGIKERKQREKLRRKQQILVAARRLFRERGYKKTTIEGIGDEAELSSGTIYLYYKGKKHIYIEVLTTILEYLYMRLMQVVNQVNLKIEDRIELIFDVVLEVYSEDPVLTMELFKILSQEDIGEEQADNMLELRHLFIKNKELTTMIFENSHMEGLNLHHSPRVITDIFWASVIGASAVETGKYNLNGSDIKLGPKLETIFAICKRGALHMARSS